MKKPKILEKGYKELRKSRYSQKGAFYFITTCCHNRQKFFLHKENVQIVFDTLDWLENKGYIDIKESIWQEGYYDHLIKKDENLLEIIRYCWYNSVRAGIVDDPKKYPYWRSKYELL